MIFRGIIKRHGIMKHYGILKQKRTIVGERSVRRHCLGAKNVLSTGFRIKNKTLTGLCAIIKEGFRLG